MTRKKKKQVTLFFSALPQFFFPLLCFAAIDKKLHRNVIIYNVDALKLSITFSDRAIQLSLLLICTYSIYYWNCNTNMGCRISFFSFQLWTDPVCTRMSIRRTQCTSPSKAHPRSARSASSKKGLGTFLFLSRKPSDIPAVAATQWMNGSDGQRTPSNTNELDLAKGIWSGNTHMGNKSSARQPSGDPFWPIEIFMPAGFRRSCFCARALCGEMVSDLNSAEHQIPAEQPRLEYSETKR